MKKFFVNLIVFLFLPILVISSIRVSNGKSPIFSLTSVIDYVELFPRDSLTKFESFIDKWNSNSNELEEITENFNSTNDFVETLKLVGKVIVNIAKYLFLVFELLFIVIGVIFDGVFWVLKLPNYILFN